MPTSKRISEALLGTALDPFSKQTRQHIALVAFLAWVGLGADGLSSSCYGPEQAFKLEPELVLVVLLLYLNLRGIQESIKVLLPIFLGFFFTHVILIGYGVVSRADHLPALIPETLAETGQLTQEMGWVFAASLFLRAYSLGGGTYTGIEAVSNNVQSLAEPRVSTGKWTMI